MQINVLNVIAVLKHFSLSYYKLRLFINILEEYHLFLKISLLVNISFVILVYSKILIQEEIKRRLNSGNACYHSAQNLLSSRLLSKNIKVRIYNTIWVRNLVSDVKGGT
jgi:hypothetical protein